LTRFYSQVYVSYLIFQLVSHKSLYVDKNGQKPATIKYAPRTGPSAKEKTKKFFGLSPVKETAESELHSPATEDSPLATDEGRQVADEERPASPKPEEEEEDEEIPELSLPVTIVLLVVVTVFVAVTAEWLVDSISGLTDSGGISKEFIGLILLPIVGNAAEHVTAVTVSVKDKLTLSLGVAVGSSIVSSLLSNCSILDLLPLQQIALFVIPFIVTLGWMIGHPLTMLFDPFESIVLFFSVLTVNYVVQDGKSNWLEGMILICLCVLTLPLAVASVFFSFGADACCVGTRYIIIALVFWFYPGTQLDGLLTCSA
jgi:Ca2+:H+ antiporter